jgi:transposase
MPRIKVVELRAAERAALEQGQQSGATPAFRNRCQMILLKSGGRTSSPIALRVRVAEIVGVCEMWVPNWVHRDADQGIYGLQTKPGRGRKAILQDSDLQTVKVVVAQHRRRLSVAKAELEQVLDKSFCQMTLRRFVKKRWPRQTNPQAARQGAAPGNLPTQSRELETPGSDERARVD